VHFDLFFAFSSADGADSKLDVFFRPGVSTFNVDTGYSPRTWIPTQCRVLFVGCGEPAPPS
jgi:hypothetical protein